MALVGIYHIIPSDYIYTLRYIFLGIILPYSISLLGKFLKLKISMISEWLLLYIALLLYGYINNTYILVFSVGSILTISIGTITGTKVILFNPFKYVNLKTLLSPYITLFFTITVIIWNISFILYNKVPFQLLIIAGILIFILSALYIDFFAWLNNLIKYILKIDMSEIERVHRNNMIKLLLKEISPLWTRNKAVINLQSLANNTWLINEPKIIKKEWLSNDTDIIFFWNKNIDNRAYAPVFKDAVGELLMFLDKYGHCPSVVKEQKNSYGKYGYANEQESYDILYKQTLINHTLQVCNLILSDEKTLGGINQEKMLITALGHDIGKAASFNNIDGYKTGDHPNTSIMLIETRFEYFDKLHYADEVMKMIKNHHSTPSASTPLLQDFKEYDSKARRMYLKEYFKNKEQEQQKEIIEQPHNKISEQKLVSADNGTMTTPHMSESAELSATTITEQVQQNNNGFVPDFTFVSPTTSAEKSDTDKNNNELKKLSTDNNLYIDLSVNSDSPDYYSISSFFDINEFIKNVAKNINIIDKGRFSYITVNGDMVLCYTASVIFEIKKAARLHKVQGISEIKDNELGMSFTEYCRKLGILHTGWIQEGYFQGNFILTDYDDNTIRSGRYIPLKIDAFEPYGSYADFEERKKGDLENIINAKVATKEDMF